MKSIKKLLPLILIVTLIATNLTGCSFKDKTVATINNEKISESLYRICLWLTQRDFESLMPEIWSMDYIDGKTPEQYAKDRAMDSLKMSIAAKETAQKLQISLTKDEKKIIKEKAKEQMNTHEAFATAFKIKQTDFEEFLSYNKLVEKVIGRLGDNYVPNEEEIGSMTAQIEANRNEVTILHIFMSNRDEQGALLPEDKEKAVKEMAELVLDKSLQGEDFETLIKAYSQDEDLENTLGKETFKKDEVEPSIAEVAFETGNVGEVYPKLIETSQGYEIIKLVERQFEEEEILVNEAIAAIKLNFAKSELAEMSTNMKVETTALYEEVGIVSAK